MSGERDCVSLLPATGCWAPRNRPDTNAGRRREGVTHLDFYERIKNFLRLLSERTRYLRSRGTQH